jgi:hypothetical protein
MVGWRNWGNEMNLRNVCRVGFLPFALGAVACSDMDPGNDTFSRVYPLEAQAGSAGDGPTGNSGSGGDGAGAGGGDNGPAPNPAWDCLGTSPEPLEPLSPQPQVVTYAVPIVDFANPPTPPAGLVIQVCQSNDTNCASPVPHMEVQVDPMRPFIIGITIPYQLDGYLTLEAPGYVPTEYYFGGPMIGSLDRRPVVVGEAIPMLRQATMDTLFDDVRETRAPGTGVLAIRTIDCRGIRAAGVQLEPIDEVGFQWTLLSNIPRNGDEPTDGRGVGGFGNVVPGVIAVQGKVGEDAFGRTALRVKPDQFTVGEIRWDADLYGR